MKELSAQQFKKIMNSDLIFQIQKYQNSPSKHQYINDLINFVFIKQRINPNKICLNQLAEAIKQIGFQLNIQQTHQLYLFATFDFNSKKKITTKQKIASLVNQERKKINIQAIVQWINNNFSNIRRKNINRVSKTAQRSRIRILSSDSPRHQKIKNFRLPTVTKSSHTKLQNQLQPLIAIFDQMEKLRQNSGLIPINFDQDESNLVEVPFIHIPYDPELYDLNQSLTKLRIKAEIQLKRIIQLAKQQPQIKKKLELAIQKFQKSRIQANQKIGRTGAINAQKRLVSQRQKQMNKHKNLRLDYDQDLLRAARVYSLLSIPQPKVKPIY